MNAGIPMLDERTTPLRPFRPGCGCLSAARTHQGMVRRLNEDACLDRAEIGLWAVADGMGGHDAGDFASSLIVGSLRRIQPPSTASAFLAEVIARMQSCNEELRSEAASRGPDRVIASTVVALLVFGGHYACVWAGDSRLYLLRENRLRQISRDHSYVQELVDLGVLAAEEAKNHPQANVVTRAVGAADSLDLEMRQDRLRPTDVFLLCSDGLTKVVPDEEIAHVLSRGDIAHAAQMLIDLSLQRGAPDNVTVIVVNCGAAGAD